MRVSALLTVVIAGQVLAAAPPKPRVMVIVDTSRSMTQKPDFGSPPDYTPIAMDPAVGGDWDPTLNNTCVSKICTAKKVVWNIIPSFTSDARIGLTTYFQYVVKADQIDSRASTCTYDVIAAPNQVRTFTSFLDFTGSGTTVCPGGALSGACSGGTRAQSFPDRFTATGTSGDYLDDKCATPSGYTRPANATLIPPTCSGADCYLLTKTATAASAAVTCNVFTYPRPGVPKTYDATSQCSPGRYDSFDNTQTAVVGSSPRIQRQMAAATATCAGTAVVPSTTPGGASAITATSINICATGTSTNCYVSNAATSAIACTAGAPCNLFLHSTTPTSVNTDRSWYAFFTNTFTPAAAYGNPPNSYSFSANVASVGYTNNVLTGSVTAASCPAGGRIADGTMLSAFGIANARNTLDANGTVSRGTKTHETPTASGTDFSCAPGWPCDVNFTGQTPNAITWNNIGTVYNNSTALPANQRYGTRATNTYVLIATNPSVSSCPAINSSGTTPANVTWDTAPTGCTGSGMYACTFGGPATGSRTAPGGTCADVFTYTPSSPGTCSWNGKPYGAAVTSPIAVARTTTGACTTGTFSVPNAAAGYTGCGNYPCDVSYTGAAAGAPVQSAWQASRTSPPAGYSGAPTSTRNSGTPVNGAVSGNPDTCIGSVGSTVDTSGTLCGGGSCTVKVLGNNPTGANNCLGPTNEGDPCYACSYQKLEYQWEQPTTQCNYTATRYQYSANRTTLQCTYTRDQWPLEQQNTPTFTCNYSVGARRYDFNQPQIKICEYWAVQNQAVSPRTLYTYEYLTKGTEIVGRAKKDVTSNICGADNSGTWAPGNTFGTACPATVANCGGLTGITSPSTVPIAGGVCKLRYGGGNNSTQVAGLSGRYSNYQSTSTTFDARRACEENSASTPANPDTYQTKFCDNSGSAPAHEYKLVSDWYDPALNNAASAYNGIYPPAVWTTSTDQTPMKKQGYGALAATATIGSGAVDNRSIFVPIPNEASYNAVSQKKAIEDSMARCILPSQIIDGGMAGVNANGRLIGGACVSDMADPAAPGWSAQTDFTPLYGSLRNTYDYMLDRWTNDDDAQECRDYFMVLATDGLENTPKGYTVAGTDPATSVQGLVGSFRNTSTVSPRTRPDVKTFVIGFGQGTAGSGSLDAVAQTGGTNQAYSATSLSELQVALNAVFTIITQGTFSRSKPALGTDGTRLYAAQYVRPTSGPDWSGLLTAYKVLSDGSFSPAWEYSDKLDGTAQGTRSITVGLRKKSDGTRVVGNFTTGNAELMDQMDDRPDFPAGLTSSAVTSFLRTKGDLYFASSFRRGSAAGPIVSSSPIIIAKSPYDLDYGGTGAARTNYNGFVTLSQARGTRVMFGGNDGMIHSLVEGSTDPDCTALGEADQGCPNGTEAWAYVPGSLRLGYKAPYGLPTMAQSLFTLMQGSWAQNLLDNPIAVADVCADGSGNASACTTAQWKTIAIGSQRGGGRGVFAINVTNNTGPSTTPDFLWDFTDTNLGFSYSTPAVGRANYASKDQFVAVFGGGLDDPQTAATEGRSVFVVNALDGTLATQFTNFQRGSATNVAIADQVLARPATYRRPGAAYMDSAFVPVGPSVFAMRFNKANGTVESNTAKWQPDELFDPTSTRNSINASIAAPTVVNIVAMTSPGTTTVPPTYALQSVGTLPLSTAPPIYNRPKLSPVLVPNGTVTDLFVGTGNVVDPTVPGATFGNDNYFYAIHDFNQQGHNLQNDGRALWVVKFPGKEQVVSEPALITGCIVVATFTPPAIAATCGAEGDTTLYGFSPITGALTQCLNYPTTGSNSWGTKPTSVLKMTGVGIPSDLVVVNDNIYFSTSKDGLKRAPVRQPPMPGEVRSYRRIK